MFECHTACVCTLQSQPKIPKGMKKTLVVSIGRLNVWHPHVLLGRRRKLSVCFYVLRTMAALCYYSEEMGVEEA